MKRRHLLTALAAVLAALSLAIPSPSGGAGRGIPRLVFPVVGQVNYFNDFGAPRGRGGHQGNDLMAKKKSPVVAVEKGRVSFWTRSRSAGCMLYLRGASGTVYQYIHLNNDRTMRNDNRGRCVPGTAYAKGLRNGARVAAGQQIGYVGDSGDANGIASHLHFEIHPRGKGAVCPYRYLRRARVLLFAAPPRTQVSLTLRGKLLKANSRAGTLTIRLTDLKTSTGLRLKKLSRKLVLALSPASLVIDAYGNEATLEDLDGLSAGSEIEIATTSSRVTLGVASGAPRALVTFSVTIPA